MRKIYFCREMMIFIQRESFLVNVMGMLCRVVVWKKIEEPNSETRKDKQNCDVSRVFEGET